MLAHLVLRSSRGAAKSTYIPTAATIKGQLASASSVRKAESVATELGFKVVNATPLQVTIEGPKSRFEKVFLSKVKAQPLFKKSGKRMGKRGAVKMAAERAVRETPHGKSAWTWETPPSVPEEMQDVVAEVVLPAAISLHG